MKASATSDFSPPESSDRRFMALPAGVTSTSTPGSAAAGPSSSVAGAPPAGRGSLGPGVLLAAQHRPGPGGVHQPQAPAATGEQVLDDLLEVARRGLEGLLEADPDLPVGLLDQALELGQRVLEVRPLALELLNVGHGLLVLLPGQRVDRAQLLATSRQAL